MVGKNPAKGSGEVFPQRGVVKSLKHFHNKALRLMSGLAALWIIRRNILFEV